MDLYFGRGEVILAERDKTKRQTLARRRLQHHAQAVSPPMDQTLPS
jgi:hypothetical protein